MSVDAAQDDVSTTKGEYKPSKNRSHRRPVGGHQPIQKFEMAISRKVEVSTSDEHMPYSQEIVNEMPVSSML